MRSLITIAIAQIAVAYSGAASHAAPPSTVVYESLTNPAGGGSAYGGGKVEIGQSISLQGTERCVTQIDLLLGDNTNDDFRVRFFELDADSGEPAALLWESPIQTFPYTPPSFNRKVVSVSVPAVFVPDSVAYTIAPVVPATANLVALTGTLFPSVGVHESYWYRRTDAIWRSDLFSNGTLGARLFAVIPEPNTIPVAVVLLAAVGMGRRVKARAKTQRRSISN